MKKTKLYRMIEYCTAKNKNSIVKMLIRKRIRADYQIIIGEHTEVGNNIYFPHPMNIVLGDGVKIGDDCTIYHGVTLGQNKGKYPCIGNNVIIYPNAIVVGDITIGNNVVIGAGGIVTKNIPDNAIISGNPGAIIGERKPDNQYF